MKRAANKRYLTQWGAQYYVAAELSRRGYLVSFTLGNAETTDLIVISPNQKHFRVEVKGQKTHNFWRFRNPKTPNDNLYYILVYLSLKKPLENPRFFILTCSEIMNERKKYQESVTPRGNYDDSQGGMNWGTSIQYENKWEKLPN